MFKCRRLLVLLVALSVLFSVPLSVSASDADAFGALYSDPTVYLLGAEGIYDDMCGSWIFNERLTEGRYEINYSGSVSEFDLNFTLVDESSVHRHYVSEPFEVNFSGVLIECSFDYYDWVEDGTFSLSFWSSDGSSIYDSDVDCYIPIYLVPIIFEDASSAETSRFFDIVSSVGLDGVFSEVISLLPVLLIVLIGFIGVRKGISWLNSVLRSA